MKKRTLLLSMVGITALVGCDVTQITNDAGEQVIVKLEDGNGFVEEYTANDLFKDYSVTSTGASQYFNAVYDVLIRTVQKKDSSITNKVNEKLEEFVDNAKSTASQNNTSYKTELSEALENEGVEDLAELERVYYLTYQKEKYESDFYDEALKGDLLNEYIDYYAPYHVRHILAKISSSDSLYKGTLSQDDAKNISSLVTRLASDKESFGDIARSTASTGDTGSAEQYGDVGFMSTLTSFVSEFKFSIYQYEALYNTATAANIEKYNDAQEIRKVGKVDYEGSHLIPESIDTQYLKDSINRIPYSVFEQLGEFAAHTSDQLTDVTKNSKEEYYPRNILFNHYLNKHSLGVITNSNESTSTRFQTIEGLSVSTANKDKVLCDETGKPILVSRAGTGSGDSGYQGIHFIIIENSPFAANADKNYWNIDADKVEAGKSYISYIGSTRSEWNERANSLKSAVKEIDSNMNFRIYEQALKDAEALGYTIKISDYKVGSGDSETTISKLIEDYITTSRTSSAYTAKETYEDTWDSYEKLLKMQDQLESLIVDPNEKDGDTGVFKKITGEEMAK